MLKINENKYGNKYGKRYQRQDTDFLLPYSAEAKTGIKF